MKSTLEESVKFNEPKLSKTFKIVNKITDAVRAGKKDKTEYEGLL